MNGSLRKLRRSLLPAALLLACSTPALAQDAPPGQEISPEARAVIDRMNAYMKGLQAYSIQAHGTRDEVIAHGYKLQHNESASLSVQRPNQMRAEVSGDLRNRGFYYDGKTLVVSSPDDNAYASTTSDETLGELIGDMLDSGVELPLVDVLYSATAGTLTENVRTGTLVGDAMVEGVACDHLAFRQTDADWQLWVEKGARALPRKIVITTRHEVGDPQFSATLTWNTAPRFTSSTFTYAPPKDARQIPFVKPDAVATGGAQ